MPFKVTIKAGLTNVIVGGKGPFQGGDVVLLTDDAYSNIPPAAFNTLFQTPPTATDSSTPLPEDQGLLGWAYDPAAGAAVTAPTAGQVQLTKVILRQPATITNLIIRVAGTAGVGLTNTFAGLYDAGGTLRGQTVDQSTSWQSTGAKMMALTTPYSAPAGAYYVGLLFGAATTAPSLIRSSSVDVHNIGLTPSTYRSGIFGTGLTALPASITMASVASGGNFWWVAVS